MCIVNFDFSLFWDFLIFFYQRFFFFFWLKLLMGISLILSAAMGLMMVHGSTFVGCDLFCDLCILSNKCSCFLPV